MKVIKPLFRLSFKLAILLIASVVFGLLVLALKSRSELDYALWHTRVPRGEFEAKLIGDTISFEQYLELEKNLFAQLPSYYTEPKKVTRADRSFGRYFPKSPVNPANHPQNFNRSYELVPKKIRGGILLLHGLSDSPYSMRQIGEYFYERGFYVLNLRLPGHGVVPSGLLKVSWFDWVAAVRVAARKVDQVIGADKPFYIGGYSNGGTLALYYATDTLFSEKAKRAPDRLILFSPAVGISKFARASNWHKLFSWIPGLQKSKWLHFQPEYDPYKFNSFTKNAGAQIYYLSVALQAKIEVLKRNGKIKQLAPVLTFQSIVDSTIVGAALIEKLYSQLESNNSELVVFDINHAEGLDQLFRVDTEPFLRDFLKRDDLSYRLSVLTNKGNSTQMIALEKAPFSAEVNEQELELSWPRHVFSLSHVAIPFSPEDPLYGDPEKSGSKTGVTLGSLAPRGEKNVLRVSAEQLLRLRYNPFFSFIEKRLESILTSELNADSEPAS